MALGGLHSKDKPGLIIADGFSLRDADVSSFYPNGILSYDVYPEHLERNPSELLSVIQKIVELKLNILAVN